MMGDEKREAESVDKRKEQRDKKKPSEIVQGYDPSLSFADILYSFEHTGEPFSITKKKNKRLKTRSFSEIFEEWESGGKKKGEEVSPSSAFKKEIKKEVKGENKAGKVEDEKIETPSLFKTEDENSKREEEAAWSVFGKNSERKKEEKPVEEKSEEVKVKYEQNKPFEEILREFESLRTKGEHKGENSLEGKIEDEVKEIFSISKLRSMRPEVVLDLHGERVEEAKRLIREFIADCKEKGIKKISIITGKGLHSEEGLSVLKSETEKILELSDDVREIRSAPFNAGGAGAFWVILKS